MRKIQLYSNSFVLIKKIKKIKKVNLRQIFISSIEWRGGCRSDLIINLLMFINS